MENKQWAVARKRQRVIIMQRKEFILLLEYFIEETQKIDKDTP